LRYLGLSLILGILSASAKDISIAVVDKQNQPVAGMVVYLTPVESQHELVDNPATLLVTQKNKAFAPYVAVSQKGQHITFENKDNITHHIYSVSGNNRFDFKIKAGHSKTTEQLNHAQEVAMGCNIHDWMSGYVLVVDTPYYTQTNEAGLASVNLTYSGRYTLSVWHPQLEVEGYTIEQMIEVDTKNAKSRGLWQVKLPKDLLPLPEQVGQDEFEFLDEY